MGSRFKLHFQRGRVWHEFAGAASFASGVGDRGEEPRAEGVREPWLLKTTDTLRPGERGTKGLAAEYGDRLVCVRYRCDPKYRKKYKTVEFIVSEGEWTPPPSPDDAVRVRIAWGEKELRERVKEAGGRWKPESKTWEVARKVVEELGLAARLVPERVSRYRNFEGSQVY